MKKLKFIDLFAGLGGFHLALQSLGHECVFASELNHELRELYTKNHKTKIEGDINAVDVNTIPAHDILCAGFPCQPFSKAGAQLGLDDPKNGNLFYKIIEICAFIEEQDQITIKVLYGVHIQIKNKWTQIQYGLQIKVKEAKIGFPLAQFWR